MGISIKNMRVANPKLRLTKENIFKFIDPGYIYKLYLGKTFKYNKAFSSPLREDKNPSFTVSSKTDYYRDFSTGDSGDCFTFVKVLYNLDFNSALKQIVSDAGISGHFDIPTTSTKKVKPIPITMTDKTKKVNKEIKVKVREFEKYDLDFWNCAGISLQYLKIGRIYAIKHFYIGTKYFKAEKHAYVYVENKDGIQTYKIYQPFSKTMKWINSNNFSVWELWELLPARHDKLIITSSRKDALSIIENLNIPSTAFQSETIFPKEKVVKEVLERFKKVYLLLDNDYTKSKNAGQEHALKLVKQHGFTNLVIPNKYKSKDFTDLVCNTDRITASNLIKNML